MSQRIGFLVTENLFFFLFLNRFVALGTSPESGYRDLADFKRLEIRKSSVQNIIVYLGD